MCTHGLFSFLGFQLPFPFVFTLSCYCELHEVSDDYIVHIGTSEDHP